MATRGGIALRPGSSDMDLVETLPWEAMIVPMAAHSNGRISTTHVVRKQQYPYGCRVSATIVRECVERTARIVDRGHHRRWGPRAGSLSDCAGWPGAGPNDGSNSALGHHARGSRLGS